MHFLKKYGLPFLLSVATLFSFGHMRHAFGWHAGYLVFMILLVIVGWLYHRVYIHLWKYALFAAVPILILLIDMYTANVDRYFPGIALLVAVVGILGFAGGVLLGIGKRMPAFFLLSLSTGAVFWFVHDIERHLFYQHLNSASYADLPGIKPHLTFTDLSGKPISDSTFQNKVVLLDFWYTGCGGCWQKQQYIDSLYNHYKGRADVAVYSVIDGNLDSVEKVQKMLKKYPLQCPVLYDPKGKFIKTYQLLRDGYPLEIKLDKTGTIREVFSGFGGDADKVYYSETIAHINQFLTP